MTNTNLDKALELSGAHGFAVFPVKPDKAPYTEHGVKDATCNQGQIEAWWAAHPDALVGVATGPSGITVLDVDVKKGKNGYAALQAAGVEIPNTFHYSTPSGGEHWVYLDPKSDKLSQATNLLGDGVDRQSGKSYVVWYGDAPWTHELTPVPDWLRAPRAASGTTHDAPAFSGDLEEWINGLSRKAPGVHVIPVLEDLAATPHIGNGDLLRFTRRLARLGIENADGAHDLFLAIKHKYWTTSNEPDLKKEVELNRLLRGAIGQAEADKAAGSYVDLSSNLTAKVNEETGEVEIRPTIETFTLSDLRARPKPKWWVDGLLKESSIAVFAGQGGLGKTFLMLHLSACIASGRPFFGRKVGKGKVVYVGAEGIEDFVSRIDALCHYHSIPVDDVEANTVYIEEGVSMSDSESMSAFSEVLADYEADIIVLDTFSQLAHLQNENDAAQVANVMRVARKLRSLRPNSTVILVHHAGKDTGRYRGSSAIRDNVDTLVSVTGKPSGFTLSTMTEDAGKQRSGKPMSWKGFELLDHLDSAVVALTGAATLTADEENWRTIRKLLEDGGAYTLNEIADLTGLHESTVKTVTRPMRESGGLVETPDPKDKRRKLYSLTPIPGDNRKEN